MRKSNLQNFFETDEIQSSDDYFLSSRESILKLVYAQSVHEHRALKCIISIGKTLSELHEYKKRIKSSKVNQLWSDLLKEVGFSPATVTKYIKISNHPILSDKKFIGRVPASVFSLYELTKIEPVALQMLIESREINATTGRSVISSLSKPTTKRRVELRNIKLMSLSLPKDEWIKKYKTIEHKLLNFLDHFGIKYEYSSPVLSLNRSEENRMKHVERYVFLQSKKHFNEVVRKHIDQKCKAITRFAKSTSFKNKMKHLKYGEDEVTTLGCVNIDEVSSRLKDLGLTDESEWNQLHITWFNEGLDKYPSKLPAESNVFDNEIKELKNFTPVKKTRDFSDFKV